MATLFFNYTSQGLTDGVGHWLDFDPDYIGSSSIIYKRLQKLACLCTHGFGVKGNSM